MPRPPLTRLLARALNQWRHSGLENSRADAYERTVHATGLRTRRRFLRDMSAIGLSAGGLLQVAGCGVAPRTAKQARIAIIGAGIAGLNCARLLRNAGVDADVYDAASRLGGRILTDHRTFPGMHCELGGEFINTDHTHMRALARDLDIPLLDFASDQTHLDAVDAWIGGQFLAPADITRGFAPIAKFIAQAVDRLPKSPISADWKRDERVLALDRQSLAEWLDEIQAHGPVRQVIEAAYTTEFGLDPQQNNALNMLLMISSDAQHLALLGESDERYHAAGGNDRFVAGLAARLDPARVHPGQALVAVRGSADGRYVLSFARNSAISEEWVDHLVLAMPFSVLRDVQIDLELPADKRRAINELGYGANSKLVVGFSARPWRDRGMSGNLYADLPFQSTWDSGRLQGAGSGMLTSFMGGTRARAMGEETQARSRAAFLDQIDQVIPGAKRQANDCSVRIAWHQQPFARASYSSYLVGQYSTIAGTEEARVGRIYFCGEHTCPEYQAYMEGGARSGARVAEEVIAGLK